MLYSSSGCWNGEQILDPEFVHSALSVQIMNPYALEQKDGRCGYGYQLWACSIPGVYRFDGGQGQYGIIWPEKDLVVAVHEGALVPLGPQRTLDILMLQDEPLELLQDDYRTLLQLESSVKLKSDEPNTLKLNRAFRGSYRIKSGDLDPWFSVAPPGNVDLFVAFRDSTKDIGISVFELDVSDKALTVVLDNGAKFIASWDGSLTRQFIDSPFPALGTYAATARFIHENMLEVHIHWLNGWFETQICFELVADEIVVTIKKLRLNLDDNFLVNGALAVSEKGSKHEKTHN